MEYIEQKNCTEFDSMNFALETCTILQLHNIELYIIS